MVKRKAASECDVESDVEETTVEEIAEDSDAEEAEIADDSDDEDYNPQHEQIREAKLRREFEENPIQTAMHKCHHISVCIRNALVASRNAMQNPTHNATGVIKFVLKPEVNASCEIPESDTMREIKPYQVSGINFLLLLYRLNVGGAILADEMGLGKTIQVIAFLGVLKNVERNPGPHLVVAPVSVLENWKQEIARWCPFFRVVVYHHGKRNDDMDKELSRVNENGGPASFHILITSYSIFERKNARMKEDRQFLRKWKWNCVILDEGHVLKDATSMRSKKLQDVVQKAKQRIMLTGTPIQNDLPELWSLLSFLMPDTFNANGTSLQDFLGTRNQSVEDRLLIANMQVLLRPFVMRRTKSEVLWQLLSKRHYVLELNMIGDQAQAYEEAHTQLQQRDAKCTSEGEEAISNTDFSKYQQTSVAATTGEEEKSIATYKRKVCNHPLLVRRIYKEEDVQKLAKKFYDLGVFGNQCIEEQVYDKLLSSSDFALHKLCEEHGVIPNGRGKLDDGVVLSASTKCQALATLLAQLKHEGHRCLLFSQWTKILDILEWALTVLGHKFIRLDGSTSAEMRQALVDQYNHDPDIFIFLISTRAGAQGLNLIGADTVIIHDMDFNPQMDRQAEDRCHRIGQLKRVTVYRLVTMKSVDEEIYNIARKKLNLDAAVLQTKEAAVTLEAPKFQSTNCET